jgi:5-methylcytosine-specific restriction enzyme A
MSRPGKICGHHGCHTIVLDGHGRCVTHRHIRRSPSSRTTGSRDWRKLRAQVLARDRHRCRDCGLPATEVHHVVSVSLGGTNDPSNLRALCDACHAVKHRRGGVHPASASGRDAAVGGDIGAYKLGRAR